MTFASPDAAYIATSSAQSKPDETQRLLKAFGVSLLAIFVVSAPNLIDPFIRHDDYPALFGDAQMFWGKTLTEGRWLNYLWHLRGIATPAWLNFAAYQILSALLAAALAVAAMGREGHTWFIAALALFILGSVPATLISLWFNTLLPGLAVVALYAVLGCYLSQRSLRILLPLFVIVSFWAYPSYSLILLAVCLMRTKNRSFADLAGLMVLFIASFAAAVLLTYTINWYVHGIFGVPLADWREATPASGLTGMIENLPYVLETFRILLVTNSYNFLPAGYFHIALLIVATGVLIKHAPKEALYLHAGRWAGIALMVLQSLKLGVAVPSRAFSFAWIYYAVIVVRATALMSQHTNLSGRLMRNCTLLIALSYLLQTFFQYATYHPWQAETRLLAERLRNVDPAIERPVLVYGDVETLESAKAAHLQRDLALTFRIQQLTGHKIVLCHSEPKACTDIEQTRKDQGLPPAWVTVVPDLEGERRFTEPSPSIGEAVVGSA